jgi:hypothetical protein
VLLNEGDYDAPVRKIVHLRRDETALDTPTRLEHDVLYVFARARRRGSSLS